MAPVGEETGKTGEQALALDGSCHGIPIPPPLIY